MSNHPNFLFVVTDQLTAFALRAYGNRVSKTPYIDALTARGTLFRNAYCNFPICAPSRASMLSGQLSSQIGVWDNGAEFAASVPTVMHYLSKLGYQSILCGKMHFIGPDQLHGYTERLTTDIYPADFSWTPDWRREGPPEAGSKITLRGVVEAGVCQRSLQIDYDEEVQCNAKRKLYDLARSPEQHPFFLTVSYTHPHNPFTTTQEYWDRYNSEEIDPPTVPPVPLSERDPHSRRHHYLTHSDEHDVTAEQARNARRAYYGMVSYIDDKVGELVKVLEETGLAENTIIVFTSDHGEMLGEKGMWYKMCLFEPSIRVPLIICLPNDRKARRVAENVSLVDLLPTFLDLASGGSPPELADRVDGRSFAPLLYGEQVVWPNQVLTEYTADGALSPCFSILKDQYKLVWSDEDGGQLYNLHDNPSEMYNLFRDPASSELQERMIAEIHRNWNVKAIHKEILKSQQRRLFIFSVSGGESATATWDFQPLSNASRQYVRSGMSPAVIKGKARFPYREPVPPDRPRS